MKLSDINAKSHNVGKSDYSKHKIQPWDIWEEYNLNPWDADIVKRVLRTKEGESRTLDYEKIIHICQYRIEVLKNGEPKPTNLTKTGEVLCPSEKDKPAVGGLYNGGKLWVYSVFQGHDTYEGLPTYYAYLGCRGRDSRQVYLNLSPNNATWKYEAAKTLPQHSFTVANRLDNEEHVVSMKIGGTGTDYETNDYIIDRHLRLIRYCGVWVDCRHMYKVLGNGPYTEVVATDRMIPNIAHQIVNEEWKQ